MEKTSDSRDQGWISLHRKIKDHWIYRNDKKLKWWLDILLTVNYADSKVLIKGRLVECKRGQSVRSLETWAKEWGVTKKTVSDFFKLLYGDSMIYTENLKISTRITVCNYDNYQRLVNAEETHSKRRQPSNNKNEIINNNGQEPVKKVKVNPIPKDAR